MARLNWTHDQVRSKLYSISSLHEDVRHEIAELIIKLSDADDWYPDALRRSLHSLQDLGSLQEVDRHTIEKTFFPDHAW